MSQKERRPVFVSCHFYGNKSQLQKVMLVGCDWVDFDPSCFLSMLKDGCRKITSMHITLNAVVIIYLFVYLVSFVLLRE